MLLLPIIEIKLFFRTGGFLGFLLFFLGFFVGKSWFFWCFLLLLSGGGFVVCVVGRSIKKVSFGLWVDCVEFMRGGLIIIMMLFFYLFYLFIFYMENKAYLLVILTPQ